MVKGDQSPVGDSSADLTASRNLGIDLDYQIFNGSGVEQLDIGGSQDLGKQGRSDQSSVFDHHKATFVFVGDVELVQELVAGLAEAHC